MTIIEILIIAQILLETIPVSSSGHLALIQAIISRYLPALALPLPPLFLELLNCPTLFALAYFFRIQLLTIAKNLFQLCTKSSRHLYHWFFLFFRTIIYAIIANLVTTLFYALHHILYPSFTPDLSTIALGMTFIMLALLSLKYLPSWQSRPITLLDAITIGLAQSISLSPGISRLGITFITAQWLGINPRRAFQFSFLLHAILSTGLLAKTIFLHPALPHLSPAAWLLIAITTPLSILGLKLSHHLANTRQFWKFALYYPIPLTALMWLIFN